VYALPGLPGIEQPDFVTVAKKVPSGVICLLSALYFHELTVQIPRWVDVAVRQTYHPPVISHPPVHFHWFSDAVFESGVEPYDLRLNGLVGNNPMRIKIYSPEKSIVDCFRLRRKVGIDVALEALKTYWLRGKVDIALLRELAKASRALKIMTPYIESVIHDQS
jgi:predicted transcriptional regulator of viral defense system